MQPKDQSHPQGTTSISTSAVSSMTYLSSTSTLPKKYTPRKRHQSPPDLSVHQRAHQYSDLSLDDITQLTSILSHGPAPHLNRNGVIWSEYRERVTQLIETLPHRLRRSRLSSWMSPLCNLHRHMNHAPLEDILNAIKFELEVRRSKVWQPVLVEGLLIPELVRLLEILSEASGLWIDGEVFLSRVGRPPKRKFEMQKDKCAACILARLGGDAEVAKALGALMLGAMRKVMVSHRVEWCREWIKHAVDAPALELADMERLGDLLREARKEWKAGRHVKGGRNEKDHGRDRGGYGSDYYEDDGLLVPPPPPTWPPRSDSQIQRYQNEPFPRSPTHSPETRKQKSAPSPQNPDSHFGQQDESTCPPSTRRSHVKSVTQHPDSTARIPNGHGSHSPIRTSLGDPRLQSGGRDAYQTSPRQAHEPSFSPPPPQTCTRPSSQSWTDFSLPLSPSEPRPDSESSQYSEPPLDNVPHPNIPHFAYQVEPPTQSTTATTHTVPTHIYALHPSFQRSSHWEPGPPQPMVSPDSMTGVYRGTYSTSHQPLYFPHILPHWTTSDGSSVPVTAPPQIPIGYWGPIVLCLAVPDGIHGVETRTGGQDAIVEAPGQRFPFVIQPGPCRRRREKFRVPKTM